MTLTAVTRQAEIERLEREIDERRERIALLRNPITANEVARLAREDPNGFNALFEDGLIPASALGATTPTDDK